MARIHETAIVAAGVRLGSDVSVGAFSVVNEGVQVGDGSTIGAHAVIGEVTADYYEPGHSYVPQPTVVGPGAVIRSHSVVYSGATVGQGFESGHHVTIREGSSIGDGCRVGSYCDIQGQCAIGDYVRFHSGVFLPMFTTVEDLVWIFPHAVLTNDPHPPSDSCITGPTIRRAAVVGAASVVMPGIVVGEGALVAARSLVTRDVPDGKVAIGAPARIRGAASEVMCRHRGEPRPVYPWPRFFRRGYPDAARLLLDSFLSG